MDDVKALKEKLKKKNETIKKLREYVETHKDLLNQYLNLYHRYLGKYEAIKKLIPLKYYKITFEIWKQGKCIHRGIEFIQDHHYSSVISDLRFHYMDDGVFKLIDILEVAS